MLYLNQFNPSSTPSSVCQASDPSLLHGWRSIFSAPLTMSLMIWRLLWHNSKRTRHFVRNVSISPKRDANAVKCASPRGGMVVSSVLWKKRWMSLPWNALVAIRESITSCRESYLHRRHWSRRFEDQAVDRTRCKWGSERSDPCDQSQHGRGCDSSIFAYSVEEVWNSSDTSRTWPAHGWRLGIRRPEYIVTCFIWKTGYGLTRGHVNLRGFFFHASGSKLKE